jgi:tRNA(adenine34) deaminase
MDDRVDDDQAMQLCFDLAIESARRGDYPFAAIVARKGKIVAQATNRVSQEGDVTRHPEVVALAKAQKALGCTSLDGCTLYSNIEPRALCAYAVRETRIGKVVFALSSPHMGGFSRWNILGDEGLSRTMPDVFAPPPAVVAHFMSEDADRALRRASPIVWAATHSRGLLGRGTAIESALERPLSARAKWKEQITRPLRRRVFDRFGRGGLGGTSRGGRG